MHLIQISLVSAGASEYLLLTQIFWYYAGNEATMLWFKFHGNQAGNGKHVSVSNFWYECWFIATASQSNFIGLVLVMRQKVLLVQILWCW
jgi:hypothetical protein